MKRIIAFPFFLAVSMMSHAQDHKPALLQEIFYTVQVQENEPDEAGKPSWHQDLEASAHDAFVGKLLDQVKAGKLKVFEPQYPYKTPMSVTGVKNIVTRVDSVWTEDIATGKMNVVAKVNEMPSTDIAALGFHENWYYDSTSHVLDKEVKGIVFLQCVVDSFGGTRGMKPLFYLPLNAPDMATIDQKNIAVPQITYDMRIMNPDPGMRESDWWYENLEPSKRYAFVSSLYVPALNGKLQVYKAEFPFEDKMSVADLENITTVYDTILVEDYATGELMNAVIMNQTAIYDINCVRFHETWYFDPLKLAMYKRVKGFALMQDIYDHSGELEREKSKPLFYVKGKEINNPPSVAALKEQPQKKSVPLLQEITYPVRTLNPDVYLQRDEWWHQRLEPSAHYHLINPLLQRVRAGELTVYRPVYPYSTPMTKMEWDSILNPSYEVILFDEVNYTESVVIAKEEVTHTHIYGLGFHEDWHFDTISNSFQKQVKGIILNRVDVERGHFGYPLLYIPLNALDTKDIVNEKNLITTRITYDVRIMNSEESSRETEWWAQNLEPSKRAIMRSATFDRAQQGKLNVYSAKYPFTKQLKGSELKKAFVHYDTVLVEDIQTGRLSKETINTPVNSSVINGVRFHEEWYFDHSKMAMQKVVKGMVLLEDIEGESGQDLNSLFYVPLNGNLPIVPKKPLAVNIPRVSYMITADEAETTVKGLDTARFLTQLRQVVIEVKKGGKTAYRPLSMSDVDPPAQDIIAPAEWRRHFEGVDTILIETEGEPIYRPVPWELPQSAIRGVRFTESWNFDPASYTFSKQVSSIDISVQKDMGPVSGYIPVYTVLMNPEDEKIMKNKALLLGDNIENEVQLEFGSDGYAPYDTWWNDGLEISKRMDIIQKMLDDVSDGRIKAYDPATKKKLARGEIKKRMICKVENYENGTFVYADQPLTHEQVYGLRFHEEWYFDAVKSIFLKKVKGITLMTRQPGKEALEPVFYIKTKD